jgi:hypothetical protein
MRRSLWCRTYRILAYCYELELEASCIVGTWSCQAYFVDYKGLVYGFLSIQSLQQWVKMFPNFDPHALFEDDELEATWQGLISYDCPCKCCHGAKRWVHSIIKKHLKKYGWDPYFHMPMVVCIFSSNLHVVARHIGYWNSFEHELVTN